MRWLLGCFAVSVVLAQPPVPGRNDFLLRGQRQEVYFIPSAAAAKRQPVKVLFIPGDGGWRGFAIDIGQTMAGWGYDVFGVDTRRYLESFTGGGTALKESQVAADMREFAVWIGRATGAPVHLVGWSTGAGLGLLGVAAKEGAGAFTGLIALGLPERSPLGWRTADNITWITKREPNEPAFRSADFMAKTATPLLLIHSSGDEYTPVEAARKMFAAASQPKRFVLIQARNHHYDGNHDEFFRALREGLGWLETRPK